VSLLPSSPPGATDLVRVRRGGVRVERRSAYPLARLEADCEAHARIVRSGGPARLGTAPRRSVARVEDRIVKHYTAALGARLRQALGRGRARCAWRAGLDLEALGIPTARPLALREAPGGAAWLVTEAVDGSSARAWLAAGPSRADARELARELGRVVARLAAAGLRHDDLTTKNVFVRRAAAPGGARLALIDLDNMRRGAPFEAAALAKMLGQLGDLPGGAPAHLVRALASGYRAEAGRVLPAAVLARAQHIAALRERRRRRLRLPY